MTLPDVTFTIEDHALGLTEASAAGACVFAGVTPGGTANTLYGWRDATQMAAYHGKCPAVEAAAYALSQGASTVYILPIAQSSAGAASVVTQTGSGAGTVAVGFAPASQITAYCSTGGAHGTAKFQFKLGSGAYSTPVTSVAGGTWAYRVPGTFTTLTFTEGTGYDAGDTWTISTIGVITQTVGAAGGYTGDITSQASSPFDHYTPRVEITTAGALATAKFHYSLDYHTETTISGATEEKGTWSATILTPAGGKVALTGTGIYLTLASTFVADDVYDFKVVPPTFTTTEEAAALAALKLVQSDFGFVHVVGFPASASAGATLFASVDTKMGEFEAASRYVWALIDCPTSGSVVNNAGSLSTSSESDSTVAAAFAACDDVRVAVGGGDCFLVSPLTGLSLRRPASWMAAARAAKVKISEDLGWVGRGTVSGVTSLCRDEAVTPALDEAHFITLRSLYGRNGYFITNSKIFTDATSDYSSIPRRRVMDEACRLARQVAVDYINSDVRVDATTGYIDERDAQKIEAKIRSVLDAGLVATGNASSVACTVSRTTNILSTESEPITIRVTPKAYMREIAVSIGFINPALAVQ